MFHIDGLGPTVSSCRVEGTMLETRRALADDLSGLLAILFRGVQTASARDKLQYHTLVHFPTNRRRRGAKKDQPSCRCSSGTRKSRAPRRARATFLSLRGKSLPPSCSGRITDRGKSSS